MDTDVLVRDYLGRLEAAAASLPVHRRAELAAEVRDHIDAALTEAGRSDEVTVRNILERLGSPEEIVAGEPGQAGTPDGAAGASVAAVGGARSRWGGMEVTSLLLLGLAWPALFLPFGLLAWLAMGVVGLVLAWASSVWSTRQKLTTTVVVVALYAALFVVTYPVRVVVTPAGSPVVTSIE